MRLLPERIESLNKLIPSVKGRVFRSWSGAKKWLASLKQDYLDIQVVKDPPKSDRSAKAREARGRNKTYKVFFEWWRKQVKTYHKDLEKELRELEKNID